MNPTAYFACQFRLTNRVIEYERVAYSFFDMAGDVGGFGEFLHVTFLLLIGGYANRMFIASIIQEMFRVRLATGKARMSILFKQSKKVTARRQLNKAKSAEDSQPKKFELKDIQTPEPTVTDKSEHGVTDEDAGPVTARTGVLLSLP